MINFGFVFAVFGAGLLSFFSPCILPLLPVYTGFLVGEGEGNRIWRRFARTLAFVGGLAVTFVLLGFGAGALGSLIGSGTFFIACGLIVFLLGLHQTDLVTIPLLNREKRAAFSMDKNKGVGGAFLLGLVFSFAWTPCVGPVLASVLGLTSGAGGALAGGLLLLVYALGLGIPFLVLTLGAHFLLDKVKKLHPYLPKIKIVGGVLIAIMGLWMIFSQVHQLEVAASGPQASTVQATDEGEDFTLQDTGGSSVSLSDYRGKPVYIKFWASWCPSCLAGLEDFEALAAEHEASGDVQVLSIVAPGVNGEMDADAFAAWAKAQELDFTILLDEGARVNTRFGVSAYPTSVFIDENGQVVKTQLGDVSPDELSATLESLADGSLA